LPDAHRLTPDAFFKSFDNEIFCLLAWSELKKILTYPPQNTINQLAGNEIPEDHKNSIC
jgi:hypothetical protein